MPPTKSLRSGHVGEHVVAEQQVGLMPRAREPRSRSRRRRTRPPSGRPARVGRPRDVGGRLDAEHRDAALHEVLQQVAVVAGDLDDLAAASEAEALDHRARRSAWQCSSHVSRTTRSTRSRRRCAPGDSNSSSCTRKQLRSRRRRAADRTAPSRWPLGRRRRSSRAATCRGRRTSPRAGRRRTAGQRRHRAVRVLRGVEGSSCAERRRARMSPPSRSAAYHSTIGVERCVRPQPRRPAQTRAGRAWSRPSGSAPRAGAAPASCSQRRPPGQSCVEPLDDPRDRPRLVVGGPKFQAVARSGSLDSACASTR